MDIWFMKVSTYFFELEINILTSNRFIALIFAFDI